MEKFKIRNRHSKAVLFTAEIECASDACPIAYKMRNAVKWAIKNNVELSEAYLRGVNLAGVNLAGVVMRFADLGYADLRYADLRGADLTGTDLSRANLIGAKLRFMKTHMTSADLTSIKARNKFHADD